MENIVNAQMKLDEAQKALKELRNKEAKRFAKAGSIVNNIQTENTQLKRRVQELELRLQQEEESRKNYSKEKALLMSGKSNIRLLDDEEKSQQSRNVKNPYPDLLKDTKILPRTADDLSKSGFYLQMSTDYLTERNDYCSGHVTVAPTARGRIRLKWAKKPNLVQIVKRPGQGALNSMFWRVSECLKSEGIHVVVDHGVIKDLGEREGRKFLTEFGYTVDQDVISCEPIDFIVVLGGDGTMIWTSNTHQKGIPPIVAIGLGSLGFLTPFKPGGLPVEKIIRQVIHSPEQFQCSVRSRANVSVFKKSVENESSSSQKFFASRRVLNEVVIDRGPTSTVVELEISINNKHIGTVQGDGLILSTPTGSTAYSVVAGGSLIHPALSALAVTPICCNPLSFRPFVVSDSQTIRVGVPESARTSAFVSFDGGSRVEIKQGEFVECKFSKYPLVWFCAGSDNEDWLDSIEHSFRMSDKRERRSLGATNNHLNNL